MSKFRGRFDEVNSEKIKIVFLNYQLDKLRTKTKKYTFNEQKRESLLNDIGDIKRGAEKLVDIESKLDFYNLSETEKEGLRIWNSANSARSYLTEIDILRRICLGEI